MCVSHLLVIFSLTLLLGCLIFIYPITLSRDDLLPDKLKKYLTKNKRLDVDSNSTNFNRSAETEVGSAEEQPARDSRTEGNDREDIE